MNTLKGELTRDQVEEILDCSDNSYKDELKPAIAKLPKKQENEIVIETGMSDSQYK
ncbi:MAG: hypothetical protein IK115_04105 [Lachnospiraceae bacterium]|nr:hypothetical protein [Lachnospiraceae bacterium]